MDSASTEDLVLSLFADVHYFFNSPSVKPLHDRFDKSSYVYFFENATHGRARIEIANNAGTKDQDAFEGQLDGVSVRYSFKHPTLISFEIAHCKAPEWHLPAYNLQNDHRYLYKLHTVDTYFWTKEDALQLFNSLRRVLPTHQFTILHEPTIPPSHFASYVDSFVQTFEDLALHSPSNNSKMSVSLMPFLPGPPVSATPCPQNIISYKPLPYNPVAPPSPEKISHREKTPPNEDWELEDSNLVAATLFPFRRADSEEKIETDLKWRNTSWDDPIAVPDLRRDSVLLRRLRSSQSMREVLSSTQPHFASSTGLHKQMALVPKNSLHNRLNFSQSPSSPYFLNRYSSPCYSSSGSSSPSYTSQHKTPSSLELKSSKYDLVAPDSRYLRSPGTPPIIRVPGITIMDFSVEPGSQNFTKSLYTHGPAPLSFARQMDYMGPPRTFRVAEFDVASKPNKPLKTPMKPSFARFEGQAAKLERGMGNLFKKLERRIG